MRRRGFETSVLLTNNRQIKKINRVFRGKNKATDVLSFPSQDDFGGESGFYGDLAISIPKAKKQAKEYNQSLEREIAFLSIHGSLHLLGYDHETETDEKDMREAQRTILKTIKESSFETND